MVDFEGVNERQSRVSASKIVVFQIVNERQSRVSASERFNFEESVFEAFRVSFTRSLLGVGSGRVGRSPIRFFDLILNNALALRASHAECSAISLIFVGNGPISNKECAAISPNFVRNRSFSNEEFGVPDASACIRTHNFSRIFVEND